MLASTHHLLADLTAVFPILNTYLGWNVSHVIVPNLDLVTSSAEEHTDRKRKKYLIKKPSCKGAFAIVTDSNFEQRADVTRLDLLTTSKHLNNQTFNHHHHHHHHHRGLLSVSDAVSTISSYMQANHRKTSSRRQEGQIMPSPGHARTHTRTDGRTDGSKT